MKTFPHIIFVLSGTVLLLGGCGGGSGGAIPGGPMEYTVREAAFESLASRLEDAEFTTTLPGSGTATYSGYVGAAAGLPGGAALFFTGDAGMTARFAEGTVSGQFDRFIAPGGAAVPGSAVLTGGQIGPAGITADVSGEITASGERYTIDGTFAGAFLGASADSVTGVLNAALSSGAGSGSVTGEVWLER